MSDPPVGVRQAQIEDELLQLRRARGLQQHEVNTIDVDSIREKGERQLQRARMMKDRTRATPAAMGRQDARQEPAAIPSLLKPQHVEPLCLGDTEMTEGLVVYVRDNAALIQSTATSSIADRTKDLYCGEKGRVVNSYPMLAEGQRGVDLKFLDGETYVFAIVTKYISPTFGEACGTICSYYQLFCGDAGAPSFKKYLNIAGVSSR